MYVINDAPYWNYLNCAFCHCFHQQIGLFFIKYNKCFFFKKKKKVQIVSMKYSKENVIQKIKVMDVMYIIKDTFILLISTVFQQCCDVKSINKTILYTGHTIHWFHIDLAAEDAVAPLRIRVSSHRHLWAIVCIEFSFLFPFYMIIFEKPSHPLAGSLFIKPCGKIRLSKTSLFIIRPPNFQPIVNLVQTKTEHELLGAYSWKRFFCFFPCWPAITGLCLNGKCWASLVQISSVTSTV